MNCAQHCRFHSVHVHAEKRRLPFLHIVGACKHRNVMTMRPAKANSWACQLRAGRVIRAGATMQESPAEVPQQTIRKTLLCSSVTASTFQQALDDIRSISQAGADLIELRLDMLTDFNVEEQLQQMLDTTNTPKIVTMRPTWEG